MLTQDFIFKTDCKSLRTQITKYVRRAQKIARNKLDERRAKLKHLLDTEDQYYEREFAAKVKSRIEEDIKSRKEVLFKLREHNAEIEKNFLEQKRAQYLLSTCHVLREAIRNRDEMHMRAVQLQQIADRKLALEREKEKKSMFFEMYRQGTNELANTEMEEKEHEQLLEQNLKQIWDLQVEKKNKRKELEKKIKLKENAEMKRYLHIKGLENIERKAEPFEGPQYRQDLIKMIEERAEQKRIEKENKLTEEREVQLQLRNLAEQEKLMSSVNKRKVDMDRKDFIKYSKHVRQFTELITHKKDENLDDLGRLHYCTKLNLAAEEQKKSLREKERFDVLNQQMKEKSKRKAEEDIERREIGKYVNTFVQSEENALRKRKESRLKHKKQLELQIEEHRKAEEMNKRVPLPEIFAVTEPEICQREAHKYLNTYNKYLPVHPHWKYLEACADIGAGDAHDL
ncbi:trichohyalin-like [Teleopsis dalmanni]|uniref:trichohyalin-like n=1 Tax=Teleopsis dalmanni TaxID=139649 RepID=UPI0018CE3D9C|nr:trichohyalin-like [Teleopsis dalmanni]